MDTKFIGKKSAAAGGWGAMKSCGKQLLQSGMPISGARTMLKANQPDGFDCPGCAWGDPEHGSSFEFCENGVKAVAWEATEKRATPAFFADNTVSQLRRLTDYELELNGRLTHPMRYDGASDRYLPVSWEDAFAEIGGILKGLDTPNRAEFYTSGRASNEAAFLYQLFVRLFGTNNFPDCSNMCHEASGIAMRQAVGVGKGTVLLEDFEEADAIFVIGQNPGTNHPRMLGDLRRAAIRGAQIVVFNPIRERGLERFSDPQDKIEMLRGGSTEIASQYLQPQLGGDMAAVRGMAKAVLAAEDRAVAAGLPSVLDHAFLTEHCTDFQAYRAAVEATSWAEIEGQSGLSREEIERAADVYISAERVICTWAMGVTQHLHSVATIREIANFMFLRGNIGKPGAGLCPVRGHSNVQGDRTVGINEKPADDFLDALEKHFRFAVPREHGHNVLAAIGAMLDGSAEAFIGLGGNFARATPDSALVEKALRQLKLTVHIATKPNHSHLMPGEAAFILPCLGRTEMDLNEAGNSQLVSVEDSMSMVHGSAGINRPASPHLLSEVAIIAGMAKATVGSAVVDWAALADDYDLIRDHIEATIPGFENYNARLRKPRGFHLRNAAAHREWQTPAGKASFSSEALPDETVHQRARKGEGHRFALQTFRSHDQYNTTVYGLDDRYRGVYGERQVIFIHPGDLKAMNAAAGDRVDVIGEYDDGIERIAQDFRLVPYDIPRGSIAGYYPELNVLVPLGSAGRESDTPTSKSIMVSFRRRNAA
ncbi:molybdopterin-dependent oxidoreductase alpha subunit [Rhizobium leguminosarum]|uniref:Molybdopterin-dependent oxidoreductase alpha subunit n=1 Tax=Rhizobium leguminosarum TaxID=384 RepID=A0AAE2MNT9_RHILE|nr:MULTISPECIES: FdhF/YdeP family oxidoreductase [Rhizobium]MBB4292644.1 molybdopterin-dependent oxidoreductase alpha subunit [Rhizobium leguminosarum]MBB4298882.1 molybdopterin-dependent oxidoreductase alpha subunit [Rhizobium leguminosarum]MBB4310145.1 molybdopterin-dependent oxidoreductase alpha subunit [Rhizobium leguminosarum]MBB4434407.1 molybdopterin-dependent oxidoreductase alpha subunit [Rhizobium esperanzae]MBB4531303.1 molybdopterin-dependent oxidoreductase alpha subunit [Rhizobium 